MNPWYELLPETVEIGGKEYEIRADFRAALDICVALNDPELDDQARAFVALDIFYPDFETIPDKDVQEAVDRCIWFINGGDGPQKTGKSPRLVDWEQDFTLVVAPVNRVMGQEIRAAEHLHWWTFLSAYQEIGDCTFAQVVRIRDHLARGKRLDKQDREWYNRNRHLVDFQRKYTQTDDDICKEWGGG